MTDSADDGVTDVGVVAIGRNEGDRLVRCLASLRHQAGRIVYVDSGSTDRSIAVAEGVGAHIVNLDTSVPFTAARARNAGLEVLRNDPAIAFVHFVDGDCEVAAGWIARARGFLSSDPCAAVVCGRRQELFPDASLWNRLADEEWAGGPSGQVKACGGDAMMRIDALAAVGGFNPTMIAGEEPELCLRLRAEGWTIWRLDEVMTYHDAALTRFGQWWQRARRAGYTYAEGVAMHGFSGERHNVDRLRRTLVWGLGLPLLVLTGLLVTGWAAVLALLWPAQFVRLVRRGMRPRSAFFLMLAKFAEVQGAATWALRKLRRQRSELIEYK